MKQLFLILLLFLSHAAGSQVDFNDYQPIVAKGDIPEDFTKSTYEKIDEGLHENRKELGGQIAQREFLLQTGYAIDELLHSGIVLYGDQVSDYINDVAKKVLKGKRDLKEELRFYTVKSNIANAFSTDQGIIFITTGLISQLSSEAQLAFILAHEICHYTEKHVQESFVWRRSQRFSDDWLGKMSVYSKEKEHEADAMAVEMYRKAGYSKEELLTTFDVLLYSYLPFEEIEISLDYFASDKFFLPNDLFPDKEFEISAEEDADDTYSSHPNVQKRKELTKATMDAGSGNWEDQKFLLGKERFIEIRSIARFESVRSDILEGNFADAIYSIYILERDYPNSIYLKRKKAQAWLGLYQYSQTGNKYDAVDKKSELEGQSASVHFMIRKLTKKEVATFSVRHIYDIYQENKDDKEIEAIYHFMFKQLASFENFDLDDYSKMSFEEASNKRLEYLKSLESDTTNMEEESTEATNSKYKSIKKSRSPDNLENELDTSKYYMYGLSDLHEDQQFKTLIAEAVTKKQKQDEYDELEEYNPYSNIMIGADNFIVVEPTTISYSGRGVDYVRSEKLEERFSDAITKSADMLGTNIRVIDSRSLALEGTDAYNDRSLLMACLHQVTNETDIFPFPTDYSITNKLTDKFSTGKVMFTVVDHTYRPEIYWAYIGYSVFFLPTAPFVISSHIPMQLMKGNNTNLTVLVLDIESGQVVAGESYFYRDAISKYNLTARMYNIFYYLSQTP